MFNNVKRLEINGRRRRRRRKLFTNVRRRRRRRRRRRKLFTNVKRRKKKRKRKKAEKLFWSGHGEWGERVCVCVWEGGGGQGAKGVSTHSTPLLTCSANLADRLKTWLAETRT